jgi:uncharacterized protein
MVIKRKILEKLRLEANKKKISILIGARQVGKTTLMKILFNEFCVKNKCVFIDVDIISNYEKVNSFENLINEIKLRGYKEEQKEFFYIFLDEFQRYPDVVRVMKNVYDNYDNIKIFASGSSSLTIKNQIQESLAGRKIIHEIFPLDFEEFLIFKKQERLVSNLKNIPTLKGENLSSALKDYRKYLEEFLIFGGYPEVILNEKEEDKKQILESVFDLYVKKDLVEYLKIDKILDVKSLIEFLAVNNGQKIKYEEITKRTSLDFGEIKKYIEILSETYLIKIVRPFYTNKNKEIVKIPKIYFIDNGVRNYFVKNFNELKLRNEAGSLFEGYILSELLKCGKRDIKFWQDKNLNEIDFILEEKEIIPIEVKFKENIKSEDSRCLEIFLKEYENVKKGYLINLAKQEKSKNIIFITPYVLNLPS